MDFGFPAMFALIWLAAQREFLLMTLDVCLLHECGHALAMHLTGAGLREIRLGAVGMQMRTDTAILPRGKLLCIYLSGPAVNLTFAAIFWHISLELAMLHLCMGLFNLLPYRMLDGGAVLRSFPRCEGFRRIACIFLTVGMTGFAISHALRNPVLYLMAGYLLLSEFLEPDTTKKLPIA